MERGRAAVILGVAIDAPFDEVRDAYRRRARAVHPDVVRGDGTAMAELNAAYAVLSEPTGPDWVFVRAPDAADHWIDHSLDADDDDPDGLVGSARGGALRWFGVALLVTSIVVTTLVFVAAVGYDWSVSP